MITEFALNCSRDQIVIKQLIQNNARFRKHIEDNRAREMFDQPHFLQQLLSQSIKNSGKRSNRYDEYMKDVGLYLFIIAGPLAYETLQKNLPLPSKSTVKRQLGKEVPLREGALQVNQIKEQLDKLKLPLFVWAAEDDTKIQVRLRYNIENNTIMGLELPLDRDGMPIESSFKFTTIAAVREYIEEFPKSSYAKLVTCKSLHADSKTFVVIVYGTSGTDQSSGVKMRWEYIFNAFREVGITLIGNLLSTQL